MSMRGIFPLARKNGVPIIGISEPHVLEIELSETIDFSITPRYRDRAFLYQKYCVERLSIPEIASLISCAESTVFKYLKLFAIPLHGQVKKRAGFGLAYGRRIANRSETRHKSQEENIKKMWSLRRQGFSFWKIADIFNTMKVATQTGRGKWHARSVKAIMDANNQFNIG